MKKEIIKTVLHLTDRDGFSREYVYFEDWKGYTFMVPVYHGWADEMIDTPYPLQTLPRHRDFKAIRTDYEQVTPSHHIKTIYMKEV